MYKRSFYINISFDITRRRVLSGKFLIFSSRDRGFIEGVIKSYPRGSRASFFNTARLSELI